jgi:hypothetical protein
MQARFVSVSWRQCAPYIAKIQALRCMVQLRRIRRKTITKSVKQNSYSETTSCAADTNSRCFTKTEASLPSLFTTVRYWSLSGTRRFHYTPSYLSVMFTLTTPSDLAPFRLPNQYCMRIIPRLPLVSSSLLRSSY